MEELCIKAIEIGIPIICFTDHVDFNSSEINVGRIINKASTNFDVSEANITTNDSDAEFLLSDKTEFSRVLKYFATLFPPSCAAADVSTFRKQISLEKSRQKKKTEGSVPKPKGDVSPMNNSTAKSVIAPTTAANTNTSAPIVKKPKTPKPAVAKSEPVDSSHAVSEGIMSAEVQAWAASVAPALKEASETATDKNAEKEKDKPVVKRRKVAPPVDANQSISPITNASVLSNSNANVSATNESIIATNRGPTMGNVFPQAPEFNPNDFVIESKPEVEPAVVEAMKA